MVYQWKPGTRIKTDPNMAADVMNDLAARECLNAQSLVDASRPEDAPLHQEFEWDDQTAAEEYRRVQARYIIRSLIVNEEADESEDSEPVRVFFHVNEDNSNYTPLDVILRSADSTEVLREQALKELIAFKRKYAQILKKIGAEETINQLQMKFEMGA